MAVFQCGAPKSGNFWLYKIIQQILSASQQNTESFIQKQEIYQLAKSWELNYPEQSSIDVLDITNEQYSYRISSIYRMPVDEIASYISQSAHIWSHSPICTRSEELFSLLNKKIYIIRDPRDRAVSAARYYCSDYMLKYFPQEIMDKDEFLERRYDEMMKEWVWHVFDFLRLSQKHNIHICYYEGFVMDFHKELDFLLEYLKLDLTVEDRLRIKNSVEFNNLKKKNPKHLHKGKIGRWKTILSDQQKEKTEKIAGPLISYLNYNKLEKERFRREFNLSDLKELKKLLL